ncbi:hypothetical protein BC835DRAFT_770818 [Cytidiella melzeri]|nr:hypothetical protein BC835DRAFT_770818 [Cytidiella melzeri]
MSIRHEESVGLLNGTVSPTGFEKEPTPETKSTRGNTTIRWVTFLLCGFVLLDVVVYSYIAKLLLSDDSSHVELEYRNPYYGLDELYDPRFNLVQSSYHEPILNLPRLVGSVDRAQPLKLAPMEEHLQLTPYGRMAIPDHHLLLSENLNMVYQFRVIDFGMESCQLALRLPALDDKTLLDPYMFRGDNEQVLINVCELDTAGMIDLSKLSWSNRPPCKQLVGTFAAKPGSEVTLSQFPCELGSVQSFGLSCAPENSNCFIDVWSSQNQTWGKFAPDSRPIYQC